MYNVTQLQSVSPKSPANTPEKSSLTPERAINTPDRLPIIYEKDPNVPESAEKNVPAQGSLVRFLKNLMFQEIFFLIETKIQL